MLAEVKEEVPNTTVSAIATPSVLTKAFQDLNIPLTNTMVVSLTLTGSSTETPPAPLRHW